MVLLVGVSAAKLTLTLGGAAMALSLCATPTATVTRQQEDTALKINVVYKSSILSQGCFNVSWENESLGDLKK